MKTVTTEQVQCVAPGISVLFGIGDPPASRNESFEPVAPDGRSLGIVKCRDVWRGPLGSLPALLLELARDPMCRTFAGVYACLQITDPAIALDTVVWAMSLEELGTNLITARGPVSKLR